MKCRALCAVAAAMVLSGCPSDNTGSDTGPNGDSDTNPDASDVASDGNPNMGMHFACPLNDGRPQRAYGAVIPTLGGTLSQDEMWTPDNVYLVFGSFSTGAHTLTIAPGTVVCFDDDQIQMPMPPPGSLNVSPGGSLRIMGTATNHVTFTSRNTGQWWEGTFFLTGFLGTTTAQYWDIYEAGSGDAISSSSEGAGGMNADPALDLQNVHLYDLQNKGVTIGGSNGLTPASTIEIHSYTPGNTDPNTQYPAFTIHPLAAPLLRPGMLVADMDVPTEARIIMFNQYIIPRSTRLPNIGLPYRTDMEGIQLVGATHASSSNPMPAVLTIDPGVTLQVANMIYVGYHQDGAADLVAVGTPSMPITFTSLGASASTGWSGVLFEMEETNLATSRIDNAIFEFAGAPGQETIYDCRDMVGNVGGEINIQRPSADGPYAGPPITHTIFRHPNPATDGVRYVCDTPACLTTDYTASAAGNTFMGFDACNPMDGMTGCGQRPLGCM